MSSIAHISLAQYELMAEHGMFAGEHHQRVELLRGLICEMNPIGIEHAMAVNYLNDWSVRSLPKERVWVSVQNPILIPQSESAPEPDVAWVERKEYTRHPLAEDVLLLVEVADTTSTTDLGDKADLYAEAGIRDYWVVDCPRKLVVVMRDPASGQYQDVRECVDEAVHPLCFPEVALRSSELFKRS